MLNLQGSVCYKNGAFFSISKHASVELNNYEMTGLMKSLPCNSIYIERSFLMKR